MKRVGLGRNQLNFDFKAVQKGPMGKAACLSFSGAAEGGGFINGAKSEDSRLQERATVCRPVTQHYSCITSTCRKNTTAGLMTAGNKLKHIERVFTVSRVH